MRSAYAIFKIKIFNIAQATTTRIIVDRASKIEPQCKATLTSHGMNGSSSDAAERTEQPRPLASYP